MLRFNINVRASYSERFDKLSDTKLAEIMLLDGCFILELFLRYSNSDLRLESDPIFTTSWMVLTLQRDLILLENQIPFFILDWLFTIAATQTATGPSTPTLPDLALRFFRSSINHVVTEETAEALTDAGIEFVSDKTRSLFDLEFKNGVFRIPPLRVHDSTDSLFRNLIAYEQCFQESTQYITSYVLLMDRLIDTAADVEVLEQRRIIANDLGGREDVAAVFNNICKQTVLRDFYFAGVCGDVNEYYHRRWNRYKAALRRDYCSNPWTIVSLIAGSLLISLTTVQTLYSVFSYYPH
ncbi:UPF0481 protein At3g47200 [Linum perenne]